MIIKRLFSLFGSSEVSLGRPDSASLDGINKASTEVIIPKGFRTDIERLTEYGIELRSGLSWIE